MFVLATTNISSKVGFMPRWFSIGSLLAAAMLFLSASLSVWLAVVFPLWVLALGIDHRRCLSDGIRLATARSGGGAGCNWSVCRKRAQSTMKEHRPIDWRRPRRGRPAASMPEKE
jgi:hypothetical protein